MSNSISLLKKNNIVIYRNSINNGDSDSDTNSDSSSNSYGVNEDNGVKITYTQDEPNTLVNLVTSTL